ncbi:response regulator [Parapedobacter sp. 2B3]|uniref:response regulator n=1 Tax=Parapedobacter sp. 2B3 TaxID=3342381 RepID=UPI0035B66300
MAKSILIIDDDEDILEILNIVFQDSGFEVILSKVGLEADFISVLHPDIVLLDVRIGGSKKKGTDICKDLKANIHTRHMPVILFSAEHDLHTMASACEADSYVAKPFGIDSLLMQVQKQLS